MNVSIGNIKVRVTFMVFMFTLALPSCKGDRFDYRRKYKGDWEFQVKEEWYDETTDSLISYINETRSGSINRGEGDYEIIVDYGEKRNIPPLVLAVDEDGNFGCGCGSVSKKKFTYYNVLTSKSGTVNTKPEVIRITLDIQGSRK